MKIAFVVHDYHQEGGHSRYVTELARRFSVNHEVHVFANVAQESPEWKIHFHHVPAFRTTALASIFTFLLPASLAVSSSFDIVHAQGASLLRCDVMTAHICQKAWHLSRLKTEKSLSVRDRFFSFLVTLLERALMTGKNAPWIIAISERVRRDLAECYGRSDHVTVIHHAVDLQRFSPSNRDRFRNATRARLKIDDLATVFLFVGDLRKGAGMAIRSLVAAPEARLVTVSRTSPHAYRRLADSLGVGERVTLCPPTSQIETYYAAADCLLFPTPYDAFGMVITEAMASGLPVVTSREAGAAELIRDGEDGFILSDVLDHEAIAHHVRRLTEDLGLRDRVGSAARRKVERHTWDSVAEKTMAVYRQVLSRRPRLQDA